MPFSLVSSLPQQQSWWRFWSSSLTQPQHRSFLLILSPGARCRSLPPEELTRAARSDEAASSLGFDAQQERALRSPPRPRWVLSMDNGNKSKFGAQALFNLGRIG